MNSHDDHPDLPEPNDPAQRPGSDDDPVVWAEFEARVVAYVDDELAPHDRAAVDAFIAASPRAAERVRQHREVAALVARDPTSEALRDLETPDATLAAVRSRLARRRWRVVVGWSAAAAALVLVAVLAGAWIAGQDPSGTDRIVDDTPAPNAIDADADKTDRRDGAVDKTDATDDTVELAIQLEDEDLDVLALLDEEGGDDLTVELVEILLEEESDNPLDADELFRFVLEEELEGENG